MNLGSEYVLRLYLYGGTMFSPDIESIILNHEPTFGLGINAFWLYNLKYPKIMQEVMG